MKPAVLAGKLARALLGLVLLVVGAAGFFTLAASFAEYPVVPPRAEGPRWLRGAYHVHTTRSDGRGTVEEVAAAAKAAGLHFVVLTDHNDFAPREPAFVDGVLLVPGVELSTNHGHLIAFGMERPLEGVRAWMEGGEALAKVEQAGGTVVLAHPVQERNPWTHAEAARQARGFELYSADTFFRQAVRSPLSRLLPAVGASFGQPVHGVMTLVTPQPESTARLLELARERMRVALCAHDAHGLPGYEHVFQALAMYLPPEEGAGPEALPGDARAAAARVTKGLASGRAVCAFRALGEPEGFALEGLDVERREARVGQVLTVRLPAHEAGTVRVEVGGAGRLRPDGVTVELVEEGAVQVEAWVLGPGRFFGTEWRPWVVPSPVRVLPALPTGEPPSG
jgi:hypothetical protein